MTIAMQIMQAALAALNAAPLSGLPTAELGRTDWIELAQLPAIGVYPRTDPRMERAAEEVTPVGSKGGSLVQRRLSLFVECRASGANGAAALAAVDPLRAHAVARLARNTLGGLGNFAQEEGTAWALEQTEEATVCLATVEFSFEYQSRAANAESRV